MDPPASESSYHPSPRQVALLVVLPITTLLASLSTHAQVRVFRALSPPSPSIHNFSDISTKSVEQPTIDLSSEGKKKFKWLGGIVSAVVMAVVVTLFFKTRYGWVALGWVAIGVSSVPVVRSVIIVTFF